MNRNYNIYSLKKRAKTFYFASLFFSKSVREDVKILYLFCRYVDDISDNNLYSQKISKKKLKRIKAELKESKSKDQLVSSFIKLTKKYNINPKIPLELINGVESDLDEVIIKNYKELIIYSYRVAGTVGLMMCKIMKVNESKLQSKGIQLGIAMQFTNIARDVKEDLNRGRIYLPREFRKNLKLKELAYVQQDQTIQKRFRDNLKKFLDLADHIYQSSWSGIIRLPIKYRVPIAVASFLYQSIGNKIRLKNYDIWSQRIYLTNFEKILRSFLIVFKLIIKHDVYKDDQNNKDMMNILKDFKSDYYDEKFL